MAFGAKRLAEGTNNMVEVKEALWVVECEKVMGVSKLHLEGDSLVIMEAIRQSKMKAWHLNNYVKRINSLLVEFENFMVSHV